MIIIITVIIIMRGVPQGSPNPDPFSDKTKGRHFQGRHFFQTWPLGRNYVIIT